MEPHVFCGPEFVLEVPQNSVSSILERLSADPSISVASDDVPTPSPSPSSSSLSASGWTVREEALLRIQTEIYGVCTPDVRRQLHLQLALKACVAADVRKAMGMVSRRMANFQRIQLPADYTGAGESSSIGSVPTPPRSIVFVEAKPTNSLTVEETSSVTQSVRAASAAANSPTDASATSVYLLLYVTDSRAAAQLHMLCLRNTFLALPQNCRLLNYYVFGGRAAAVVPSQILQKRELLATHFNFDAELWSVLEAKLTSELVDGVRAAGKASAGQQGGGGRLLTAFEQHEQDVRAVLHYCEQKVRYAGVFDDDEEASPFLIAMGLCWKLRLTMDDVCRHFARHPRRVIRALALYLARYTLAPEEYVYLFLPSVNDEVIIACTEDAQVTFSMKDLSRQLLTKNDVVDAWLPMLAKHWQDHVVAPSIAFMEACWKLQGQGAGDAASATSASSSPFAEVDGSASAREGGGGGDVSAHGTGSGIAATFGVRSIAEIAERAAQHSRVLVPQSMATIMKRRRGLEEEVFGTNAGEGEDAVDDDGSDDDDFLIHVDVQGEEDNSAEGRGASAVGGGHGLDFASAKRPRVEPKDNAASRSGGAAPTDPHRRIMREGLRLTLSLLGRRKLFKDNVEHYIEF